MSRQPTPTQKWPAPKRWMNGAEARRLMGLDTADQVRDLLGHWGLVDGQGQPTEQARQQGMFEHRMDQGRVVVRWDRKRVAAAMLEQGLAPNGSREAFLLLVVDRLDQANALAWRSWKQGRGRSQVVRADTDPLDRGGLKQLALVLDRDLAQVPEACRVHFLRDLVEAVDARQALLGQDLRRALATCKWQAWWLAGVLDERLAPVPGPAAGRRGPGVRL